MSIHYKFKSNLNFDTLTFDGVQISVGDLKKSIIKQKKLGKITDFELQVTNAQTKEVYASDNVLIPKNTSLIIARIPTSNGTKKVFETQAENMRPSKVDSKLDGVSLDLTQLKASEEEKIQAMMMQSTADYDPKSYYKLKPQSQIGEVPASYKCNKCKKGGHWIKNCPFTTSKDIIEVKRNTGIPMSFREKKDTLQETLPPTEEIRSKRIIPDELICGICKDLFVDAVMIPCCGSSFCDDCVRTALLESDDNECPDCKEKGSSPASLIPNRFLRNSVNAFRNENGYSLEKKANLLLVPTKQEESEVEISNLNEEKNIQNENTKAVSSTSNLEAESIIENQISNQIDQAEKPADDISVPKPDTKITNDDDSQKKKIESPNVVEAVIPEKQKEIKPRIAVGMEMNKTPQELVQNSHMQVCEPTSFKPIRPFTQFPPLQPQPLNTFDNMFNRIRPPMGPIQYHSAIRPRMEHVQPGYYQPAPHIINAKKTSGPVGIDTLYSGVAATLGNGIIDDPLEAFNRIMEEKEKRRTKERRSRSKERPKRWYHRSPSYDRRVRRISNSNEKRICRDEYNNKNNNRENHSSNSSRYRRSNSITMSRSRSKSPIRQHSRSPKSKRSGEPRRRNDPKERIEKKNWNERSCEHRNENSAYKFNNRTDFMRQPSPPGSDAKYSFKTRLSRSRSTSPEVKRYRKKSSDCKREESYSKHKNLKKSPPPPYCDIQGKQEEDPKQINLRDKSSPSFHASETTKDSFIKEIVEKDFAISDRKPNDIDHNKLMEEDKEKSLPKDSLKKEKKSKERKKKKKDKLEKNEKKKNKKGKKEKKNRKSADKPDAIPSSKDVSPGRTPEAQLPDEQQVLNAPICDQSLTPPNMGVVKCIFESPKSHAENEAAICQISPLLNSAIRSPKNVEFDSGKPHSTLRSFVEMPHSQSNDRNKEDILQSKYHGNSIDRRFDDRRTHSKDHFKKDSQMYQSRSVPNRRDKPRDEAYKMQRCQEDQRKNHRKPTDNLELRSVATKMHWNPRTDNPFRRNRLNEKFDSQHTSYRRRSTNVSSNSETYSDAEDSKRRLRTDKKDKDRKRIKYTSSEDSLECSRRKPLKNKKKHKNLKKKKKSRE